MVVSRSFGSILAIAVGAGGALAACGGSGSGDKPVDASTPDAACKDYQGEIIDWNANANAFCGVFQATATVRGQTSLTAMTEPNGRFTLKCLTQPQSSITVDITPPSGASQCTTAPGTYTKPAVLTLQPLVIAKPTLASVRLLSDSELATEFSIAGNGQMFQPNLGQLVIHIEGTPARAQLSGIDSKNCGPARQFNGTAWEYVMGSAAAGSDVLFPNCPLTQDPNHAGQSLPTTAEVALADGRSVTLTVEPNKLNYVTIPTAGAD